MGHIFLCNGGSGTTPLIRRIQRLSIPCSKKADGMCLPPDYFRLEQFQGITRWKKAHAIVSDLDQPVTKKIQQFMKLRVPGYKGKQPTYRKAFLRMLQAPVSIFVRAHFYNFFSEEKIENVNILVRHPIEQYLSFTKPYRHEHIVEIYGGKRTKAAQEWYAKIWLKLGEEYFKLKDQGLKPRLLRFRHFQEDVPAGTPLAKLFTNQQTNRKTEHNIEDYQILWDLTKDMYHQLYEIKG